MSRIIKYQEIYLERLKNVENEVEKSISSRPNHGVDNSDSGAPTVAMI